MSLLVFILIVLVASVTPGVEWDYFLSSEHLNDAYSLLEAKLGIKSYEELIPIAATVGAILFSSLMAIRITTGTWKKFLAFFIGGVAVPYSAILITGFSGFIDRIPAVPQILDKLNINGVINSVENAGITILFTIFPLIFMSTLLFVAPLMRARARARIKRIGGDVRYQWSKKSS